MRNNILDYLYEIHDKYADKIAYSNGEFSLTFKDVYERSSAIGTWLLKKNVSNEPVVIFMNKHPNTVTAFYGTVMAGDYYIPLDAEMPEARIRLILENVQPKFMICDEESYKLASNYDYDGEVVLYDDLITTAPDYAALKVIYDKAIDTDPIYAVFTSGSTGVPKGVIACHRSVIDYIENLSAVMKADDETVFGSQTPLYVDACLKELYTTLKCGATTYFIPKELFMFPIKLVEFMNKYEINTVCWVVSALVMISAFGTFKTVKPEHLRLVCFGSESFPIKQFNLWRECVPNARFINLYGPTEGTGMCCYYEVNREFGPTDVIPVGHPFRNTDIILLKEDNTRAGEGETGEICIRGTSLTLGYYNNPEKTAECFVQNPLNTHYPELIYKTGDLGRYNSYGELEFISRKDYQIKHMGHRIELGEIEANADLVEGVKMAGCIYDDDKKKIVLYYVGDITESEITVKLKTMVPRYMLPNSVKRIDTMPLTTNGKLNRQALKEMYKEPERKQ